MKSGRKGRVWVRARRRSISRSASPSWPFQPVERGVFQPPPPAHPRDYILAHLRSLADSIHQGLNLASEERSFLAELVERLITSPSLTAAQVVGIDKRSISKMFRGPDSVRDRWIGMDCELRERETPGPQTIEAIANEWQVDVDTVMKARGRYRELAADEIDRLLSEGVTEAETLERLADNAGRARAWVLTYQPGRKPRRVETIARRRRRRRRDGKISR